MKLIQNAMILDHDNELIKKDVLYDAYGIHKIADAIVQEEAEEVIDAQGLVLLPGLIDVHVHLREPGNEHKETIASGTQAAAHGGFTTVMAMPNVIPHPDNVDTISAYLEKIKQDACINVLPYACITKGEKGREVVDMEAIKEMGIKAFSDDGVGVAQDEIMMQAMEKSAALDVMIVAHTEDMNYRANKACMHEGTRNHELGYIGIPGACESEQLRRDLLLVEETKAHYHVCHMSAKESVELLRNAKDKGLDVSGEVTVHHLLLNEMDVQDDANYKMNPPLRAVEDQEALLAGLQDGVIDMIANDHAPHSEDEKAKGMVEAPFGIVSIETAFPLLYTHLVQSGKVTLEQLVYWMSEAPAKRFQLTGKGKLEEGYDADMVLIDIAHTKKISKDSFYSKGKNTPFDGWECSGFPVLTICHGDIVYKEVKR